jgi:hypothetical protein
MVPQSSVGVSRDQIPVAEPGGIAVEWLVDNGDPVSRDQPLRRSCSAP